MLEERHLVHVEYEVVFWAATEGWGGGGVGRGWGMECCSSNFVVGSYLAIYNVAVPTRRLPGARASDITADGVTPRGEAVITLGKHPNPGGVHALLCIHFPNVGVDLLPLLNRPICAGLAYYYHQTQSSCHCTVIHRLKNTRVKPLVYRIESCHFVHNSSFMYTELCHLQSHLAVTAHAQLPNKAT
jgi:hypothetical protein